MSSPHILLRHKYYSAEKRSGGYCLTDIIAERGWSIDIPLDLTYLRGNESNSPVHVRVRLGASKWPHLLRPAERLPSHQVINLQVEYMNTGKYDRKLFYDTANLISFPSIGASGLELRDGTTYTIIARLCVPLDFPENLLNKLVFMDISFRSDGSFDIPGASTLSVVVIK